MGWTERVALATLLLLAGCATTSREPEPPRAVASRASVDVELHARVLRMADVREADSTLIEAALESAHAVTRAAGVLAIGQIGARGWAPRLRTLLTDRDTAVAANAAFALGLLRDTMSIQALRSALAVAGPAGPEAAWALSQIGEAAREAIVYGLRASDVSDGTLAELLLAASRLRPVPAGAVVPLLRHDAEEIRWRAVYAFARSQAPAGARPLIAVRGNPSVLARAFVARGLSRTATGDTLAGLALPVLRELVSDGHPHVRVNALRSLATHGPAGRSEIMQASRDPDVHVRIAAADGLGSVLDAGAPQWAELWTADTLFAYRRVLLSSMARAGGTLDLAESWGRGSWRHRAAIADAAGAMRDHGARWGIARKLADDTEPRVRAAALGALAAAGGDTLPDVRDLLRARAVDGGVHERAAALGALATRPRPADASHAVAALERAAGDTANNARAAAGQIVAALWREDSATFPATLRARLRSLAPPAADPVTRAAVGGRPPFEHWPRNLGTARPIGWYEERVRDLVVPAASGRLPRTVLTTERGTIVLELFATDAPLTVHNFMVLANGGYYDGLDFHRVLPNFVIQDGDPTGAGPGGPGWVIRDELNRRRYVRGVLGMALSGPDTGGSQYFITHSPQPHLDGGYTVFGRVVEGFAALDAIVQHDRILTIRVQ